MLDYNKLYYFTKSSLPSVISLKDASDNYKDFIDNWRRGINKPNFKSKLKIYNGRFLGEFSDYDFSLICSDKFLQILTANNLTGWDYIPIEIYFKDNTLLNGYNLFCATGKCGDTDYSRSYKGKKINGYQEWHGRYFIEDYYDGSDFFTPSKSRHIYCSEKAKQAILDAQINCADFDCLETIELVYVPKNIEELVQQRNK